MAALTVVAKLDSTDITSYLKSMEVSYEQLFTDAGRNMAGTMKATLIGTFPKVTLNFRTMSGSEMHTILDLLNDDVIPFSWYDNDSQTLKTANFYRGECKPKMLRMDPLLYDEMSVNLIAYSKL